jgi:hypothetical protein
MVFILLLSFRVGYGLVFWANLGRALRWQINGFQQILKEVEFFHNTLRLHLARLELQGTQEG